MTKDELLPCPFCGGKGDIKTHYRPYCVSVVCLTCGSSGVLKQSHEEAKHCWNTRTGDKS